MSDRFPNFDPEFFLAEKSLEYRVHESGDHKEIAFNCPCCQDRGEPTPDTKKKLWLNVEKGTFYCYRCQWAGSLIKLVQKVLNCDFTTAIKVVKGRRLNPFEHLDLRLSIEHFEPDELEDELAELELPYGYEPIEGPHPYLEKRGIPWEYAAHHDWGISTAGYTKGRIIVPTFMDSKLVFWQARATWEEPDNKDFKKVLNPKGRSARSVLYNYDVAAQYEQIIIVEGFIDAVKMGPDAVATNGKNLHPQQAEWLKRTGAKSIVLAWDADAWTDGRKGRKPKPSSIQKATDLLRGFGFQVKAIHLPEGKDPGSFRYKSKKLRSLVEDAKAPVFSSI